MSSIIYKSYLLTFIRRKITSCAAKATQACKKKVLTIVRTFFHSGKGEKKLSNSIDQAYALVCDQSLAQNHAHVFCFASQPCVRENRQH